jgi:hypothetical protein
MFNFYFYKDGKNGESRIAGGDNRVLQFIVPNVKFARFFLEGKTGYSVREKKSAVALSFLVF